MACLDFNGPQCIAPVLQQLHRLIGFDSAGYFYPGSDGELQAHLENPALAAAMPDYFDPRMLASESQVFHRSLRRFGDVVRHEHGPHVLEQLIKVPYAALLKSDYYNVVLRPAQVSNWMSLVLRTPQSLGLGMLFLYRHGAAPPFGRQETAVLAQLEPCLARLLQPGELDAEDSAVAESGLLIATPLGRLLWISPEAERLMPLAFGWRWHHAGAGARQLPLALQLLLQRLHWAWQGEAGHLGPVLPQMEWRNAGGWFSLRATQLAPAAGQAQAVAIHITQRVARAARLLQALEPFTLPARQLELAYWIARGWSEPQIAARMGVAEPTVVYHRRALYERLGVRDRQGLLERLI
ncbi:LuxR C-terminal-related transcriptional regulator [Acidovorax sp. SDU_ACID1]|uniref:helix-turn-helix transcriptional regulator n=1 Tax=Acidovorax sp. SDU_ACID1 TaxID=3136632 RepID=UPI003872D17D